jgi:hypothetical protein
VDRIQSWIATEWGSIVKRLPWLILFVLLLPTMALSQQVLFFDDFNSGMDSEWINTVGWEARDGQLLNLATCGWEYCMSDIWAGGPAQMDYTISFDLTLLAPSADPQGQGMSMQIYSMFSSVCQQAECPVGQPYGYRVDAGANADCYIARYDGNGAQSAATILTTVTDGAWWTPGVLYHVSFGRQGENLVFSKWADGAPSPDLVVSVADDTYHSGYWGMSFWWGLVAVDNYRVEGLGTVATEQSSWGNMKALYR